MNSILQLHGTPAYKIVFLAPALPVSRNLPPQTQRVNNSDLPFSCHTPPPLPTASPPTPLLPTSRVLTTPAACHHVWKPRTCFFFVRIKAHGSGCTEAFFRGHVERETKLRDGEDGQGGGKEKRRANMTELLRRIRLDGKSNGEEELKVGSDLGEHAYPTTPTTPTTAGRTWGGLRHQERDHREEEEEERGEARDRGQEVLLQQRLEYLAVSIEQHGRVLPANPPLPTKNASTVVTVARADANSRGDGGGGVVVVEKSTEQNVVKKNRRKDAVQKPRERDVVKASGKQSVVNNSREQDVANKCRKQEVLEKSRQSAGGEGKRTEQAPGGKPTTPMLRGPTLGDEGALDLLTEDEKGRFFRELASGRLGKLIVPWVPWWKHAGGVQEVVTGRTTHSLPPAVVAPCLAGKRLAGGDSSESCSLTQPPTPEEPRQQKQERQQQQQQQMPLSDLSGGGDGDSGGGGSSSSSANVVSGVASAVAHPGEQKRGEEKTRGKKEKENKQDVGEKEKENDVGRGGMQKEVEEDEEEEEECTRHSFASLQNQACMAPDFSTLSAMKPSPALPSLAVDLVYAYVLAARLYNGCWCADPVGASQALVSASPVLKDRATPATVGRALARCVECTVEGEGAGFRGYAESLRKVSGAGGRVGVGVRD